jgi:hypothetical protein
LLKFDACSFKEKHLYRPNRYWAPSPWSDCFHYLLDGLFQHTHCWKERMLNVGGKEVKMKVVAQGISTYMMLCSWSWKTCKGITYAISQYLWGDDVTSEKMQWF